MQIAPSSQLMKDLISLFVIACKTSVCRFRMNISTGSYVHSHVYLTTMVTMVMMYAISHTGQTAMVVLMENNYVGGASSYHT